MRKPSRKHMAITALLFCGGCASTTKEVQTEAVNKISAAQQTMQVPTRLDVPNPVKITDKVILPMRPIADDKRTTQSTSWLSKKIVTIVNEKRRPLNMNEVIRLFWDQGIYISSQIPLDSYTYSGLGFKNIDAETALRQILTAAGLDYDLDAASKTVVIRPMASKTWYINIGNRKTTYGSGGTGTSNSVGIAPSSNTSSTTGGSTTSPQGTPAQNGYAQNGGGTTNGGPGTSIQIQDDFWTALKTELKDRVTVLVPNPNVMLQGDPTTGQPIVPDAQPLGQGQPIQFTRGPLNQNGNKQELYVKKEVGIFTLNPETGAIYVQAPHWMLNDLGKYLDRVREMYNSAITFTGEILMVTTENDESEGLDIASFAKFAAGRYGFISTNNSLGGVTLSFPSGGTIPQVTTGNTPLASTLFGVQSPLDGLSIFNNYLRSFGTVDILQRPIVATTSSAPGEFSKTETRYYNTVSQQAAAGGTGSAATATQNTVVPVDFGTSLKINPRFDVATTLVRAQITLRQTIQSGSQTISQSLSAGNNVVQVPQTLPIITKLAYEGEALLKDGDVIIVGGQTDQQATGTDAGVTGLKDVLPPVFGQRNGSKRIGTYYFALRVHVHKRD